MQNPSSKKDDNFTVKDFTEEMQFLLNRLYECLGQMYKKVNEIEIALDCFNKAYQYRNTPIVKE